MTTLLWQLLPFGVFIFITFILKHKAYPVKFLLTGLWKKCPVHKKTPSWERRWQIVDEILKRFKSFRISSSFIGAFFILNDVIFANALLYSLHIKSSRCSPKTFWHVRILIVRQACLCNKTSRLLIFVFYTFCRLHDSYTFSFPITVLIKCY